MKDGLPLTFIDRLQQPYEMTMTNNSAPNEPIRVAIIGTSCAGKTTLANRLSEMLELPCTGLDELYWGPNWQANPLEQFRDEVTAATAEDNWIIEGNYSKVRPIVWRRATTLIWLNYSLPLVFSRSLRRTISRTITREELFAGNRESFWKVFHPNWIPWWVLRTHWRRKRSYRQMLTEYENRHLNVIEFRHPIQTRWWLSKVEIEGIDAVRKSSRKDAGLRPRHRHFERMPKRETVN